MKRSIHVVRYNRRGIYRSVHDAFDAGKLPRLGEPRGNFYAVDYSGRRILWWIVVVIRWREIRIPIEG